MLSEIFVKKKRRQKEKKVHLWCEQNPCAQKYLQKTEKEKVHLCCEPSPGLVRPSVVFVARRHFDIVVELDYLQDKRFNVIIYFQKLYLHRVMPVKMSSYTSKNFIHRDMPEQKCICF